MRLLLLTTSALRSTVGSYLTSHSQRQPSIVLQHIDTLSIAVTASYGSSNKDGLLLLSQDLDLPRFCLVTRFS